MESVGVRELKNRLGYYLHTVQQGATVVVTVRGKPVARLMPMTPHRTTALPPELEKRLLELAAEGFLAWNGQPFQVPEPAGINRGPVLLSDLVVEERA
jgi:prevent-host-death family protein